MKIKDILKAAIYGSDYISPLWKELLGCLVIFFCLIGFGNCSYNFYSYSVDYINAGSSIDFPWWGTNCIFFESSTCLRNAQLFDNNGDLITGMTISQMLCFNGTGKYINNHTSSCTVDLWTISVPSCPTCPTCPSQYTSEECQSEYDLVPSSDLSVCQSDLSSCQSSISGYDTLLNNCSTNLNSCNSSLSSCLQLNCPISTGGVSWSSLFINNIQHVGAPTINISIPSEIQWDYLNENDEFNLTIDGYNTDTDYIEGIINIQNSKPSKEDLNNIITGIVPLFVPGFVIILFIYFVFKLIKKIF